MSPRRRAAAGALVVAGSADTATRPTTSIAVGDIASCASDGDEQTAALVSRLPGPIAVLGDIAYENGSAGDFANCFDPSGYDWKFLPVPGGTFGDAGTAPCR